MEEEKKFNPEDKGGNYRKNHGSGKNTGKQGNGNKGSGKGKGGRGNNNKGRDKEDTYAKKYRAVDKVTSNDPKYYNKNKVQYDLATRVPQWAQILGTKFPAGLTLNRITQEGQATFNEVFSSFPGMLVLTYAPTVGIALDGNSPVNRAFNSLMAELYAKTSGSALNFQQADLANYFVSLASAATSIGTTKRILECKDYWVTRNLTYPKTIVHALGVADYDDMVQHYNEYVSRLNNLIALFNRIKLPARFDIFERQYSLGHNIYLDEDSDFGQLYAFRPDYLWKYSDEDGSCSLIDFKDFNTLGDMLDVAYELVETWTNSQDLYTINGALQRAFPESAFIFIEPFMPNAAINPVKDDFLELQIMNATLNGDYFSQMRSTFTLTQRPDLNALIFNPTFTTTTGQGIDELSTYSFLRAYKDSPSQDENMEMTRFTNMLQAQPDGQGDYIISFSSIGTEIALSLEAWRTTTIAADAVLNANVVDLNPEAGYLVGDIISEFSSFRYLPRIAITYTRELGGKRIAELNDQFNYTLLSKQDLDRLNETALYSIWNVSPDKQG